MSIRARELFSGVIHKCGGKVKSWNRRWMVLRSDYCLYYYKDTAKGHLGVISLRDPKFTIRTGEKSDCSWPKQCQPNTMLVIVTSPRTYFMYADNESEVEDWKRVLNSARENLVDDSHSSNKLLSGRSATSGSEEGSKPKSKHRKSSAPVISTGDSSNSIPEHEPRNYEEIYNSPVEEKASAIPSSPVAKIGGGENDGEIDVFYDTAKPELVHSNSVLYDDVAFVVSQANIKQPNGKSSPSTDVLYDEPPDNAVRDLYKASPDNPVQDLYEEPPDKPARSMKKQESIVYECVGPSAAGESKSVSPSSIQSQPLPPIPVSRGISTTSQQPLYEDILGAVLYEDIDTSKVRIKESFEASVCVEQDSAPPPPLPRKDDVPPLPPKDHDVPMLAPRDTSPPLPPKDDLPSLPPKEDSNMPPLPPKEDSSPKQTKSTSQQLPREHNITPSASPSASPEHARRSPSPKPRTSSPLPPCERSQSPVPRPRKQANSPARPQKSDSSSSNSPTTCRRVEGLSNGRQSPGKARANRSDGKAVKITVTPPTARRSDQYTAHNGHSDNDSPEAKRYIPTATASPGPSEKGEKGGMALFRKRQERVQEMEAVDVKQRAQSMRILEDVSNDPTLSIHDKTLFAETLREVEQERLRASEERFHWERARMKFEEERRKFEEEKKKLMIELDRTREQVQQS